MDIVLFKDIQSIAQKLCTSRKLREKFLKIFFRELYSATVSGSVIVTEEVVRGMIPLTACDEQE